MFITNDELKTVAYKYQINEITENDDDIVVRSIAAAIDEAQSYLRPNNKSEYRDGRLLYDVDAIFATTGNLRNALLLETTKSIALWYLVRLCNVDMLYNQVKERYDRAIDWYKKVNKGEVTLNLPVLQANASTAVTAAGRQAYRMGSRKKFNHEYNSNPYDFPQQNF